jgi:hypothetical protein
MLEKLAEARMRQARAMERFTLARARVLRAEKRFQAIRERFAGEDHAPSDEMAPETRQNPAHGDALIAAILAITQTEQASSLPADNPPLQESNEPALQTEGVPADEADSQETDQADTTDRSPLVRQQCSCEPE